MFNQVTYNVLIERFRAFASGHYKIERFSHGQIDVTDIDKEQKFPWMHVVPVSMQPSNGSRSFTLDIVFADMPRDIENKTEYQRESLSDCMQLAEDLLAEIKNGGVIFGEDVTLEEGSAVQPFMEEYTHVLTGVTLSLTMTFPWNWNACDIPADWTTGGSSSGGGGGYVPALVLKVNNVDNINQSILNLVNGTNVTVEDLGDGRVRINSTGGIASVSWGDIVGNIADQLDLAIWFNEKADVTSLAEVAFTGEYNDLLNKPTIPSVLNDLTDVDTTGQVFQNVLYYNGTQWIPYMLATVAYTGSYADLSNKPEIPKTLADLIGNGVKVGDMIQWNGTQWIVVSLLALGELRNVSASAPTNGQFLQYNSTTQKWEAVTITFTQVNADWNATSGVAEILNKPTIPDASTFVPYTGATANVAIGVNSFIADDGSNNSVMSPNAVTVQDVSGSKYSQLENSALTIANTAAGDVMVVASTGLTFPDATVQNTAAVNADWNSTSGLSEILNKPTLPPVIGDMLKSVYDTDNDGIVDSAERIEIIVRNSTGVTLNKGQVVYLSGATGNRPNAILADASTASTSKDTIGFVVANIPNNSDGRIAVNGTLHDLDTSAFAAGDELWLSETAGAWQNTPPAEPAHAVFLGYVARSHPNFGRIVLHVQNGYELNELHGVQITSEADKDALIFDAATGLWKNKQIVAADISNSTDVGKNLLTLPNPSAIRYLRVNADNSISALTLAQLKTDLSVGTDISVVLGSNVTNVGTGFEDVTGLSFAVTANKTYKWRATISYAATAAITLSSNGPATSLNNARFTTALNATANVLSNQTSYDAGTNTAASGNALSTADGIFRVTASGTWTIRFRCATAGLFTIRAGSVLEYSEVL
jgi:hypothetical protein